MNRQMLKTIANIRCRPDERGNALPAIIVLMVVLGVMTVAALRTTSDDRLAAQNVRENTRAFYAAEAGLNAVVANWGSLQYDTLMAAPGDSADLGWATVPENGTTYRAVLQQVDNGLYNLVTEGRGVTGAGGRSLLHVLVKRDWLPASTVINSAVTGGTPGNTMRLREEEHLAGRDTIPTQWAGNCRNPVQDVPGVVWGDTTDVRIDNQAAGPPPTGLFGSPPMEEDATLTSANIFEFGDFNYNDLVAMADITIPGNVTYDDINDIGPVEFPAGVCDTSVPTNWGAPEDPSHPCFDYFPVIHVQGTLWCKAGCVGQGIILADLDVIFDGDTRFYGIVLSERVRFRQNATVLGGLITNGPWDSRHNSRIQYSQCAVQRAIAGAGLLADAAFVPGSWAEVYR